MRLEFTASIDIDASRDVVIKYFADPKYLKDYQDGFVKKELVSGEAGKDGAISKMYYKYGKRDMELTETITANRLPETFEGHYHHIHMDNTMKCIFTPLSEDKTRYEMEIVYTRINWFMPRLIAVLFPSIYRKQGEKWMNNFKNLCENDGSNS